MVLWWWVIPHSRDVCGANADENKDIFSSLALSFHFIPNQQLSLERIPDPDADLIGWEIFAHTINGYDVMGGFEPCAELANSGTSVTLTELRCCLFFEARRDRHSGGISTNEDLIRDLLRSIREKVKAGELD